MDPRVKPGGDERTKKVPPFGRTFLKRMLRLELAIPFGFLALTVGILLLLTGLLAATLLLTGLLTRLLVLLARVLVLLTRVLVLAGHRSLPCWTELETTQ
jgi:hypothetical protein